MHPSRDIEQTLDAIGAWAEQSGVELVQVPVGDEKRQVAEPGDAAECDLIVAVGGDGTMLAAMHAAARVERPVLGVACGSLGVLMTVPARHTTASLERYAAGDWGRRLLPALEATPDGGPPMFAFNDLAIARRGQGQVASAVAVDAVLYARFVGDGFVVSTPVGSSAYTLAAGGPVLAPGAEGFVLTPLAAHGGSVPPLVIGDGSVLRVDVTPGYGGIRLEVDGRLMDEEPRSLEVRLRPAVVTLVAFDGQEPLLSGLRRRGLIADSPRVLARDKREGR
ncbi:MAG: kinase [Thermoleophilaceae bacterium]|nr:kinase [Thermoleophilaceae bacterium]